MRDGLWCGVCGNESDWMGPHKVGCVSCYVASGPDWQTRWLADCAAAAREASSSTVIPFTRRARRQQPEPRERHPVD